MAHNSFYTRQAQEDALVTQITNPNRVGSGFIDLGPQKRFASAAPNWQTSGLKGSAPPPLTDVLNAPRPSAARPQPPPVAQKNKAVKPAKGRQRPPRSPRAQGPKADKADKADKVAKVDKVDKVAALAAQLAQLEQDEALARQLQEEMMREEMPQQEAPQPASPEPVAVLAELEVVAAPAPQPVAKAPAPPEATTGDTTAKRVRALRKKVRDIDQLEARQREGAIMQQDQLDKIASKAAIVKELGALAGDTIEKEGGAPIDDATAKRIRALRKKVRDIDQLEERQREGAVLEGNQLDKIAGKAAIVKELGALLI